MHFKNLQNDYKYRRLTAMQTTNNLFIGYLQKTFTNTFAPKFTKLTTRKSRIKTICTMTGLERSSNLAKFQHSRHCFKKLNAKLAYPGIRKASW